MGFFTKKEEAPFVSAVIVDTGASRVGDETDGLRITIGDMPAAAILIGSFCECRLVSEVILVCREEQIPNYYDMVRFYGFDKVASVVAGGGSRQESVFAGIRACGADAAYYAVHDGARPLVSAEDIGRCVAAATASGAAALGAPVKDTIKICGENGVILSTPNRERLWAVQTPQVFESGLYREAMARAEAEGLNFEDDCRLVEGAGYRVSLVRGGSGNIRVETPEDAVIATAILEFSRGGFELWRQ